jgi:rhomboid protease GluP
MSQRDDEERELLARVEQEFGQRRAGDNAADPATGQVYSLGTPPSQQRVRLSLPLATPRAVYVLLAINVVMYALTWLIAAAQGSTRQPPFGDPFSNALFQLGAKYGPAIDAGEYWRFLTPIVLHGSLIHLGFNSYALYALGPETERVFGTGRFLALYVLAGFAGTIASYARSDNLSIGASGAIFGLIGALAAFFYGARSMIGAEASRQQVTQLITMAALNIFIGLSVQTIDNAAHIGGMIVGALAGFALAPRYRIDDRLYPPTVVRTDRPATAWALGGVMLIALVAVAALAIAQNVAS